MPLGIQLKSTESYAPCCRGASGVSSSVAGRKVYGCKHVRHHRNTARRGRDESLCAVCVYPMHQLGRVGRVRRHHMLINILPPHGSVTGDYGGRQLRIVCGGLRPPLSQRTAWGVPVCRYTPVYRNRLMCKWGDDAFVTAHTVEACDTRPGRLLNNGNYRVFLRV